MISAKLLLYLMSRPPVQQEIQAGLRPSKTQTKRNSDQTKFGPNEIQTKRNLDQTKLDQTKFGPNDICTKRNSDQTIFGTKRNSDQTIFGPNDKQPILWFSLRNQATLPGNLHSYKSYYSIFPYSCLSQMMLKGICVSRWKPGTRI